MHVILWSNGKVLSQDWFNAWSSRFWKINVVGSLVPWTFNLTVMLGKSKQQNSYFIIVLLVLNRNHHTQFYWAIPFSFVKKQLKSVWRSSVAIKVCPTCWVQIYPYIIWPKNGPRSLCQESQQSFTVKHIEHGSW